MIDYFTSPDCFTEASVSPSNIVEYASMRNMYLSEFISKNYSSEVLAIVPEMDMVDFEMRRFVFGLNRKPTRLYKVIEHFLDIDPLLAQEIVPGLLEAIRATLLLNEWYEFMRRYDWARRQVDELYCL